MNQIAKKVDGLPRRSVNPVPKLPPIIINSCSLTKISTNMAKYGFAVNIWKGMKLLELTSSVFKYSEAISLAY